jgi:hypothetical protein
VTNCQGCAYAKPIPGDAHTACVYKWPQPGVEPPRFNGGPAQRRWWAFPFNYDPMWGGECGARSETADPETTFQGGELFDLLSMLGGRL